jgi:hypothetical protein
LNNPGLLNQKHSMNTNKCYECGVDQK